MQNAGAIVRNQGVHESLKGIFMRWGSKRELTVRQSPRERDTPWLSQCLPEGTKGSCEISQVRLLHIYVGAHKTLFTAACHFDCPA